MIYIFGVGFHSADGRGEFYCNRCRAVTVHRWKYSCKSFNLLRFIEVGKGFHKMDMQCCTCNNKHTIKGKKMEDYMFYLENKKYLDKPNPDFLQKIAS